jgi:AraC family transcriptional regulator
MAVLVSPPAESPRGPRIHDHQADPTSEAFDHIPPRGEGMNAHAGNVIALLDAPMNPQSHDAEVRSDSDAGDLSVVATRLIEAACFARDGDYDLAEVHIGHALALIQGQPSSMPVNFPASRHAKRKTVRGGLMSWQVRRLKAHIDAHLAERIRTEDLAALLRLSVGHFSRAFKSTFGVPAHDYLTRRRIEVAQDLMLRTREPLGAIALSCGMSDQSHFSRWFRRIVGETPHQWRRTRLGALEDHATEHAYSPASEAGVERLRTPKNRHRLVQSA